MNLKKHWWKVLSVLIILYTFFAGLLIPLRPGIVRVSPSSLKTGQVVTLDVEGYNAHYKTAEKDMRIWLKLDNEHALKAAAVNVEDETHLRATFNIPPALPVNKKVQDMALIIDNKVDGASVLPSAVFVTQERVDSIGGALAWNNSPVKGIHKSDRLGFPFRNILTETIRNTYYHVPLWFAMFILLLISVVYSGRYLTGADMKYDQMSAALSTVGLLYGILGLITGAIWAKHTWGAYWSWDVKQNMTAVALLIYGAYFVLRNSFEDDTKRARISAVYSIFAFVSMMVLLFVIPRMTDSLHPGNGGNPAFGGEDLDNTMRLVFYPAIIGWTLFGWWLSNLLFRINRVQEFLLERGFQ